MLGCARLRSAALDARLRSMLGCARCSAALDARLRSMLRAHAATPHGIGARYREAL
jgi:hypothetical protein